MTSQNPLPAPDTVKAKKCNSLLLDLRRKTGVWHSYRMDDGIGVVEVGDTYSLTSFDDKTLLNGMLLCVFTQGRETRASEVGVSAVEYVDYRSHKNVAIWTDNSGFSVD